MKWIVFVLYLISCSTIDTKNYENYSLNKVFEYQGWERDNKLETFVKNDHVKKWEKYYSGVGKNAFNLGLKRGAYYRVMIENIFERIGIPKELYYLALVESNFYPVARSHASAVGIWQFMAATARRYGLRVDYVVDERLDPIKATVAAGRYLQDLYNVFQSWELALAAYNCGERKVLSTIMKAKTRNFWELIDKGYLPRETRNYVPKFVAGLYHGREVSIEGPTISLQEVKVPSPIEIDDVAKLANLSREKIIKNNYQLVQEFLPENNGSYPLWVERNEYFAIKKNIRSLKKYVAQRQKKLRVIRYKIRRGDNLRKIGRKFKISIKELKKFNRIKRNRIYVGNYLKIPLYFKYRLRKGENLRSLSRRWGPELKTLKKINPQSPKKGEWIKIPRVSARKVYRVRKGDTLTSIARKFRVNLKSLAKVNKIKRGRIYVGQRLNISLYRVESM